MPEFSHRGSIDSLQADHTPDAVAQRISGKPKPSYLKDFVYGAIDGSVTTFAIVSGVAGAQLEGMGGGAAGLAYLVGTLLKGFS